MLVNRFREHLCQVADLGVGPKVLTAYHQPDDSIGELRRQLPDQLDGRIIRLTDAENDFIFGIVKPAVAAKTFQHLGIGALERLENRNRRELFARRRFSRRLPQEIGRSPQAQRVVSDPG